MKINSNVTAVLTNNYLKRSEQSISKSMQRLSSGYKINNACDNPAGYAISSKMRAQIKSIEKATNNAKDGINFIKTGEGAINEIHEMIQRMNELAVKSSNGTLTSTDRGAIQDEVKQLKSEITRLAGETEFNGQPILNGFYEYKGYTNKPNVRVLSYTDETTMGKLDLHIEGDEENGFKVTAGAGADEITTKFVDKLNNNSGSIEYDKEDRILTMSAYDGTELKLEISPDLTADYDKTGKVKEGLGDKYLGSTDISIDLTGLGAMRVQMGSSQGQIIQMNIPEISLKKMGIEDLDVSTLEGARKGIGQIAEALDYTSRVRSKFGAYQNRMEHAINSLDVTTESLNDSFATLTDTNMAEEMTEYSKLQVLNQAGISMLSQANEFPQQALQLLQ